MVPGIVDGIADYDSGQKFDNPNTSNLYIAASAPIGDSRYGNCVSNY